MRTAVDSSVFWALLKREAGSASWLGLLRDAAREGPLVICPVVFAELAPCVPERAQLEAFLSEWNVRYDPFEPQAAFLAGRTFVRYRQAGGPREHLIPDFLVAAHAQIQAQRLAAIDRGYLRRWFPELTVVRPPG